MFVDKVSKMSPVFHREFVPVVSMYGKYPYAGRLIVTVLRDSQNCSLTLLLSFYIRSVRKLRPIDFKG